MYLGFSAFFFIPTAIGAIMLFVYAMVRRDIVFILTSILQLIIYSRNFSIALNAKDNISHDE